MGRTKMRKYRCLKGSERLAGHLPKTGWLTKDNLWSLVDRFGEVILKPLGGSRGAGVILVKADGGDRYMVHSENRRFTIVGKEQTYRWLKRKIGDRTYLVQRRIRLATVHDRPFDIRVIVQRKRHSSLWKVTGKAAKVAGEGYIVTNISRSGGNVLPVKTAIDKSSLSRFHTQTLLSDIERVAIRSAKRLGKIYPSQRIYGMDIGLDQNGHVWIIEANRNPLLSHFLKLPDRSMYHRILSYQQK